MSLAVKRDGEFVGEVQFFAFDGRGGCEIAIRIARKHQGKGLGSSALEGSLAFLKGAGIERIFCDVMKENLPSVSLFQKHFREIESADLNRRRFVREL